MDRSAVESCQGESVLTEVIHLICLIAHLRPMIRFITFISELHQDVLVDKDL